MTIKWRCLIIGAILLAVIVLFINIVTKPPKYFPVGTVYTIENGTSLNQLAEDLYKNKIIKSSFLFKSFSFMFGGSKGILAGDYVLDSRTNVIFLAKRMSSADYHLQQVKITLPEGLMIKEMAKVFANKFSKIEQNEFVEKSQGLEGYLFPDTYMFEINTDSNTVIKALQTNFENKVSPLNDLISTFGKPRSEVIKMASILEREARTIETKQIISGILWKRISLGMPLQVDASFKYINGKGTVDLTLGDLKIDSPYNSYVYKGLPPTPICNPGLDSIKAAITPTKTDYLYFLTDNNGQMHYAKTYQEHLKNKTLFLR